MRRFFKGILVLVTAAPFVCASIAQSESAPLPIEAPKTGLLAVVNKTDNSVSFIDVASQKIVNTLATGQGPHELVLSADGKWAVSTDFIGGDSLTVFDVHSQKVARTIELPELPGPHGIRFLNDSVRVVFSSGKSQQLGIVNILSGKVTGSIKTGQNTTHMVTLSKDETLAFTTNIRSNSISVLDLAKGDKIKDIATEAMPEAINLHTHSNELWYGANRDGKLLVVNPESEKVLASWDGFSFPYRVLFNHDQSVAIVPDFRKHNVRFFDTKNKKEIGLLALEKEAGPQGIILHPSKDIAYLSLNLKNKIVAIDIATQTIIAEYPTGNNPDGVIFIEHQIH
ncbi:YncE family protein [Glaciecola sp. SC05]|uniref:YncE family protein n=1 Tax=Glaciecola sp. SC05 TaxID=1987355 RepID=UPI00352849C2